MKYKIIFILGILALNLFLGFKALNMVKNTIVNLESKNMETYFNKRGLTK